MSRRAFTLMEIMMVIVVVGILATLGIPAYKNVIENSNAKVCETNLKALQTALDIYAMEHDTIPASLSMLPGEYIGRAYARIMREEGSWKLKLAYFISESRHNGIVYAQSFVNKLSKGDIKTMTCPSDPTPPEAGGVSYGFNSRLAGMTSREYQSITDRTILIGDCESASFDGAGDLSQRHKKYGFMSSQSYAQAVERGKQVDKIGGPKGSGQATDAVQTVPKTAAPSSGSSYSNKEPQSSSDGPDSAEESAGQSASAYHSSSASSSAPASSSMSSASYSASSSQARRAQGDGHEEPSVFEKIVNAVVNVIVTVVNAIVGFFKSLF